MDRLQETLETLRKRLSALPAWALGAGAIIALGFVAGGGVIAYRTYDYVEHDNEFCLSCHLMRDPFERFGQSAHRGLGCKACHQPTFAARSQMALTQIIENPEDLTVHADVPSDRCASCHVEGDPDKWKLIAASAGHRVHLESSDSTLQDLDCVTCHSSGVHEFVAADKTCSQSGCHTDTSIRLGSMEDLQIHCAACHSYSTPVPAPGGVPEAAGALRPDEGTCLSCHAMRRLVQMPRDDPHDGVCASCHNPHVQTQPAEAAQTCVNAGCHEEPRESSPFHLGISEAALSDCASCHSAHDFHADGENCLSCHQDVFRIAATPVPGAASDRPGLARSSPALVLPRSDLGLAALHGAGWLVSSAPQEGHGRPEGAVGQTPPFLHGEHRELNCMECHSSRESHGRVTVTSLSDCRSCHHPGAGDPRVATGECAACHQSSDLPVEAAGMLRTLELSTGAKSRRLPFVHDQHVSVECVSCHGGPPNLSAADVSCASCHEEHHEVDGSCLSCHETPADDAHDEQSHLSCAGAGCHEAPPFEGVPRTRSLCLSCHQDLVDHRTEDTCVACHPLPEPRPGGGL